MKTKVGDLLYIEWFDAATPDEIGWKTPEDAIRKTIEVTDNLCVSVGFLIHLDGHRYILASSCSCKAGPTDVDGIICIPKGMVRVLKKLKY